MDLSGSDYCCRALDIQSRNILKMKKNEHSLLKGSIILLVLFNVFNVLNFAFQFLMARTLTVEEYGILATLFAISFLFSLFSESIQTIVSKFVSSTNDKSRVHGFLNSSLRRYSLAAVVLLAVYLLVSILLAPSLKIPLWLLSLNGLTIFLFILSPVILGTMQGRKQFYALGWNMVLSATAKLVLAVAAVLIGWKVGGAIAATVLGGMIAIAVSFIPLRDIYRAKQKNAHNLILNKNSISIFTLFALLFVFYSFDVIIAKTVFNPINAGYYALASVLAKTLFIGTQPISKAMFPFSARAKSEKEVKNLFYKAAGMLLACAVFALLIFYLFPDFILYVFSGKIVPQAASILFYVGIAVTLLSLANLVFYYNISRGKTGGLFVFLICILIEIILLSVFSKSLVSFSFAFILASAIFLLASILVQFQWKN